MRPRPPRHGKAARQAALRTEREARLGWLHGYPTGRPLGGVQGWCVVARGPRGAAGRPHQVDARELRAASHGARTLRRRFPRALPDAVGDADRWAAALAQRLTWLKRAVHQGQPTPTGASLWRHATPAARRLTTLAGRGVPRVLLDAIAWTWGPDPLALTTRLGRLTEHPEAAPRLALLIDRLGETAGVPLALRLLTLWAEAREVRPLIAFLGDARSWDVSLRAESWLPSVSRAGVRQGSRPPTPVPPPAGHVARRLAAGLTGSRNLQRNQLAVMARALPRPTLQDAWATWWGHAEALTTRIRRARRPLTREAREALVLEARELAGLQPTRWPHRQLLDGVLPLSGARAELVDRVLAIADRLPDEGHGELLRVQFLTRWARVATRPDAGRLRPVLDELARLIGLAGGPSQVAWIAMHLAGELADMTLAERPLAWTLIQGGIEALRPRLRAATPPFAGPLQANLFWELVACGRPPGASLALVDSLGDVPWIGQAPLQLALALAGDDSPTLASLIGQLHGWPDAPCLALLAATAPAQRVPLGALLLGPEASRVRRLADQLVRAERLGAALAPAPESTRPAPQWIDRYPAGLRTALASLAGVDPDAVRTAERVLGRSCPSPERRVAERDALARQLAAGDVASGPLRARLARLDAAPALPPRALARLRSRLRHRTHLATLRRLESAAQAGCLGAIESALGCSPPPALLAADRLDLIAALADLEPGLRRLGWQLLRVRCGPPPWDLRDDPRNRAWAAGLRRRGLDTGAWLEGLEQRLEGPRGPVTLALETDPLEILRMGVPFGTCLKPGDINFFSTVVNAADLNKRVLFARDARGRIVGRCLLALSRDGALLTFHAYCNQPGLAFEAAAARYAVTLAERIGCVVAEEGLVPTLLASDWYDDGPEALTPEDDPLADDGLLRGALADVSPAGLRAALTAALGPDGYGPTLLARLLRQPELDASPALVTPLLADLEGVPLDAATRVTAARLARRAGQRPTALRLLEPLLHRPPHDPDDADPVASLAAELVALGQPSAALRVLRRTRETGVRRWADEPEAARRAAAALALGALGRARAAAQLRASLPPDGWLPEAVETLLTSEGGRRAH